MSSGRVPARAAAMMPAIASSSASAALRSSITANSGGTPASSGKRRSSDWQNAWIVWILAPPGVSSTRAKSRRACAMSSSRGLRPVSATKCCANSPDFIVVQAARRSLTRFAISAAAARVKVRHRMRAGSVPLSIKVSNRSVSTLVLPVPADAATQTEAAGSSALRWARSAAVGPCITRPRCRRGVRDGRSRNSAAASEAPAPGDTGCAGRRSAR